MKRSLIAHHASIRLSKFSPSIEVVFQAGHKLENRFTLVWVGFTELVFETVGSRLVPVKYSLLQGIIVVGLLWRYAGVGIASFPGQQGAKTGCSRIF